MLYNRSNDAARDGLHRRERSESYTSAVYSLFIALYSFVVLTLFLSVADIALGHRGALPAGATTCALVSLLPIVTCELVRGLAHRRVWHVFTPWRSNQKPLLALGLVATCALTFSILPGSVWDEGAKWILLIPYGFMIVLLAALCAGNASVGRILPYSAALALSLLLWSISCDLTTPGTFSAITERAAGFSGNANYTALITVMVCAASLNYTGKRLLLGDLVLLILAAAIVILSLSRSGLVAFAVLVLGYTAIRIAHTGISWRATRSFGISLLAVALALGAISPLFADQLRALQQQSRFRRASASQQVDDGSAASRLAAAQDAIHRINRSPIVGHGTGYARRMPELPHNIYLQQWVNNGLPGLMSYLAFLAVSVWTFLSRRFFPGVMLIVVTIVGGCFSHNILDQRPFLILYGLLLGGSVRGVRGG